MAPPQLAAAPALARKRPAQVTSHLTKNLHLSPAVGLLLDDADERIIYCRSVAKTTLLPTRVPWVLSRDNKHLKVSMREDGENINLIPAQGHLHVLTSIVPRLSISGRHDGAQQHAVTRTTYPFPVPAPLVTHISLATAAPRLFISRRQDESSPISGECCEEEQRQQISESKKL